MGSLLSVKNLKTYYYSGNTITPAVDGVSFNLHKGEFIGIVGESGCGKSTVARSIINLLDPNYTRIEEGEILFHEQNLRNKSRRYMEQIRGEKISMIFQNPLTSLDPVYTVGNQIIEILRAHENMTRKQAKVRAIELLNLVGIPSPEIRVNDYPHQLSGGMQQRVMIAIALACNAEIIIADEPTTALDVTIQAQILELIEDLKETYNLSMLLITHNMGIVAEMCDHVIVMYGGVIVEEGSLKNVFDEARHPYTQGLLASIPRLDCEDEELYAISGFVPKFSYPVNYCRFAGRCPKVQECCYKAEPSMVQITKEHLCRCWLT